MIDLFVSGFNEQLPDYPGGLWLLRDGRLSAIHRGRGVFGLAWWTPHQLILGAARTDDVPFVAFTRTPAGGFDPMAIVYRDYIPARRAHGIAIAGDTLFVAAAQGHPGAPMATNDDFANHYISTVILSTIAMADGRLVIGDSRVWNPYGCDHHHHYNDLLVDDRHIYLSSFTTCDAIGGYDGRGAVTRFNRDFSDRTILTQSLVSPHSLQIVDGRLYVCSSTTSSVMSVPLDARDAAARLEFKTINNFLRGLWMDDDRMWIGLSRSAGRTNSAHLTDAMNGILEFNRRTGATTRIEMPEDCDNLYTIVGAR